MSLDDSIDAVSVSFGMPVTGRGPGSLLKRAIAKLVWPFLHHQVNLNHVLIAEIRELRAQQDSLIATVEHHSSSNAEAAASVNHLRQQLALVEDGLHKVEDARHNVENALHILEEEYAALMAQREDHLHNVQNLLAMRTQHLENQIDLGQRQILARFYDGFGALQRDVSDLARRVGGLSADANHDIAIVLARMAEVDHFLREVKRSYPELVKPAQLVQLSTGFDAIARAHAARFRGTAEQIKERVAVYVPELKSAAALGPVLDIGCGTGELLDVLRENEIEAYGIDLADSAVAGCAARGLRVEVGDALHHLATVPAASLGAITAIQVVEHLGIDTLLEMIDLSLRALSPGGVLILETPNPANEIVGANSFYLDPTHARPLPSELLEFLVSVRGFTDAHVLPLKRTPPAFGEPLPDSDEPADAAARFAELVSQELLGAEDYAVIARRAS